MRRTATWLLVGAVAALGLAAAVDALRGEGERIVAAPSTTGVTDRAEESEAAARQLRAAGVTGVLTYSDEDCRLHAVSLPELESVEAPSFEMCRPATSGGNLGAVDGDVVWAGLGYGAVQVVVSREQLSRAITGRAPGADGGFLAVQAVSLDDERMLVLAASADEPRERVLAAFDGPLGEFAHLSWGDDDARSIRPSPRGRYYAVLRAEPQSARIFTRDGRAVDLPEGPPRAWAVAWSPDERWTVVATSEGIRVFASERPEGPVISIPLSVRDLDWSEAALSASR